MTSMGVEADEEETSSWIQDATQAKAPNLPPSPILRTSGKAKLYLSPLLH